MAKKMEPKAEMRAHASDPAQVVRALIDRGRGHSHRAVAKQTGYLEQSQRHTASPVGPQIPMLPLQSTQIDARATGSTLDVHRTEPPLAMHSQLQQ